MRSDNDSNDIEWVHEAASPFGAGFAFASGLFGIAFGAWLFSVICFGTMTFLAWSDYHSQETDTE